MISSATTSKRPIRNATAPPSSSGRGARLSVLASLALVGLVGCAVAPSPAPPTSAAATATVAPVTATPVPAAPSPTATPRPAPTLTPVPVADQSAVVSAVAAAALTAAPAIQATSAALVPTVATVVAGIVARDQTQEMLRQVGSVLGGVSLQVEQDPPNALPGDTRRLALRGTDAVGSLARLQPLARQLAALTALTAAGGLFPNATVDLVVVDAAGALVLRGSRQPGYQPEVSLGP